MSWVSSAISNLSWASMAGAPAFQARFCPCKMPSTTRILASPLCGIAESMAEPDWNDLRVLLAVGRTGKLSAAAIKLRADHATVSRRISALEDALQVKLLERRSTGVTLTEQGQKLMQAAEAMESLALAGLADLKQSELKISGAVRIGAPEGFGSYFLAPRLGALCDRHPELEIELVAMGAVF